MARRGLGSDGYPDGDFIRRRSPVIHQRPRRFNLIDGIVLVAATAMGLALARAVVPSYDTSSEAVVHVAISVVALWTLALLGLNFTRYRTTHQELACRPGVSAGIAFIVGQASQILSYTMMYPKMGALWPEVSLGRVDGKGSVAVWV